MPVVKSHKFANKTPYYRSIRKTDNDRLASRIKTEPLSPEKIIQTAQNRPISPQVSNLDSDCESEFDPDAFDRGECNTCPPNDSLPPKCLRGLARTAQTCRHCGLRLVSHSARILHELTHQFRCECGTRYYSYEDYHVHNETCNYRSKFFCCYQNEGCTREFDTIRQMFHHEARCLKILDSQAE